MMLVDTNVMVYAHRRDAERHPEYRDWMWAMINGPEPYAVAGLRASSVWSASVTDRRILPRGGQPRSRTRLLLLTRSATSPTRM